MLSLQVFLAAFAVFVISATEAAKVVCFYNGFSYHWKGVAKTDNITEAALHCDQLIFGYYKINSDYEIETSFKYPYPKGENAATKLKLINRNLKVLLAVGGNVENRKADRALKLIESTKKRATFVSSVYKTIVDYNYDGVDLGWQWPETFQENDEQFMDTDVVKSVKDVWNQIWRKTPPFYRDGFQTLVRELKAIIKPSNKILSISALPHVNITAYYDLTNLKEMTDQFVVHTYDYRAPQYFPKLADYSAPLHFKKASDSSASSRRLEYNVETTVSQWLSAGIPSEKLIIVIPTFGRAWEIDDSLKELMKHQVEPPYMAIKASEPGTYTNTKGLRSYYEICPHLINSSQKQPKTEEAAGTLLNRVADPGQHLGTYCFRHPGFEKGVWISFEEPETAAAKASYVRLRNLGGAAVMDLSLDDFRGMCNTVPFPILKAVRQNI